MLLCYDQVMSQSVSSAIHLTCGPQAFETAYFIEKIDKFFDCFNVSSYTAGKRKRKPFQQPYRSANDFRLNVRMLLKLHKLYEIMHTFGIPEVCVFYCFLFLVSARTYHLPQPLEANHSCKREFQ